MVKLFIDFILQVPNNNTKQDLGYFTFTSFRANQFIHPFTLQKRITQHPEHNSKCKWKNCYVLSAEPIVSY